MSNENEAVRLGIVGLGFMGQTHAMNAEELGHDVVAGKDVREEFVASYGATTIRVRLQP